MLRYLNWCFAELSLKSIVALGKSPSGAPPTSVHHYYVINNLTLNKTQNLQWCKWVESSGTPVGRSSTVIANFVHCHTAVSLKFVSPRRPLACLGPQACCLLCLLGNSTCGALNWSSTAVTSCSISKKFSVSVLYVVKLLQHCAPLRSLPGLKMRVAAATKHTSHQKHVSGCLFYFSH